MKILLILLLLIPNTILAYETSATSAILMDMDNNKIIYSNNIHEIRSVASISKIMTAILAIESGKLEETITIGDEINTAYGSSIYLKQTEEITLKDLVIGLMLRSGNDAALAIANYVGGTVEEFVILMNEKAKELNMTNSTFNNPSGLDEEKANYSTSYDMALLTSYAMKNEQYKQITSTSYYEVTTNLNSFYWDNKNRLLDSYDFCTGGKTGYTEIAKRTLVTTASNNNINLVAVTLNDGNDFEDHQNLFEEAFETLTNYEILKEGNIDILNENYYTGYNFYINENFNYLLLESEKNNVIIKFNLNKLRTYENNDEIGTLTVLLGDKEIYSTKVYITKKEEENISLLKKILNWIFND